MRLCARPVYGRNSSVLIVALVGFSSAILPTRSVAVVSQPVAEFRLSGLAVGLVAKAAVPNNRGPFFHYRSINFPILAVRKPDSMAGFACREDRTNARVLDPITDIWRKRDFSTGAHLHDTREHYVIELEGGRLTAVTKVNLA